MAKKRKIKYPELDNKEWLEARYLGERLSTTEIAKIINCNPETIRFYLKKYNIQRQRFPELYNKEWLFKKYQIEELSTVKIANILKCNISTVFCALIKYQIPHRTKSEAQEGKKNHQYGKKLTEEQKRKWRRQQTHRTKPELIFDEICKKNNLPFKYTGDGSFWIHNINPDFVEVNGKKIAVEIFGDYWHSPLLNKNLREDATLIYRKKTLKKYGWKLIVFWQTDLLRKDAEQFVLSNLNPGGHFKK